MTTTINTPLTHLVTLTHPDWDGLERRIFEAPRGGISYADYLPQGGHCGRRTIPEGWAGLVEMGERLLAEGATQTYPA